MDVLEQISMIGLVPVIKVEDAADAVPLCGALAKGGLPVAEITFRSDAAEEAIRRVHEELPDVILGAGTVLTCEQVDRLIERRKNSGITTGGRPLCRECSEKDTCQFSSCRSGGDSGPGKDRGAGHGGTGTHRGGAGRFPAAASAAFTCFADLF